MASTARNVGVIAAVGTLLGLGGWGLLNYLTREEEEGVPPPAPGTAVIAGTVKDGETGHPMADAQVTLVPEGDTAMSLFTDANGRFQFRDLSPGEYYLAASGGGAHPGYISENVWFTLTAGQTYIWNPVLWKVAGQATVYGLVTDYDTGAPLAAAEIVFTHGDRYYTTTSDDSGNYRVEGMDCGKNGTKYHYFAFCGQLSLEGDTIPLYPGKEYVLNLRLKYQVEPPPPPAEFGSLRGNVTDADTSQPIAGVTIYIECSEGWVFTTLTGADGNYRFTDIGATEYALQAFHPDYHVIPELPRVTVFADQEAVYDIQLEPVVAPVPTARINGIVTDAKTGVGLAGVWVGLYEEHPYAGGRETYTNSQGHYEFGELWPYSVVGGYHLTCLKTGYKAVDLYNITLGEGEVKEVNVAMEPVVPPGYASLYGTVTNKNTGAPIAGASVDIMSLDEAYDFSATTDSQGRYRFENIPALAYVVYAWKSGYQYVILSITLQPGESREFDIQLAPFIAPF